MIERYKVFFKVIDTNGKIIGTGCFDKEYKTKMNACKYMKKLMDSFYIECDPGDDAPLITMAVGTENPFVD